MGVVAKNPKMYDLVATSAQVEKIATGFTFTEGPIWHPGGYLLFSDIPMDVRRKWTEHGGTVVIMRPANKCNGMTLDADLNLVVCEHWTSQVVRAKLNVDGTEASRETLASHYRGKELNSPDDVIVGSDGSIYFTDPTYGRMEVYGNPPRAGPSLSRPLPDREWQRRAATFGRRLHAAERPLLFAG